jgi:hypothetical protein
VEEEEVIDDLIGVAEPKPLLACTCRTLRLGRSKESLSNMSFRGVNSTALHSAYEARNCPDLESPQRSTRPLFNGSHYPFSCHRRPGDQDHRYAHARLSSRTAARLPHSLSQNRGRSAGSKWLIWRKVYCACERSPTLPSRLPCPGVVGFYLNGLEPFVTALPLRISSR